jgi:endonuclease-3
VFKLIMPRESLANKQKRVRSIVRLLRKRYPDAACSLDFKTVHQLMVATILSAQCTDERVNKVTPKLFEKYKTVEDFAGADPEQLERHIYTTGFFVNKARSIRNSARQLIENHGGNIPETLDELVKLAGVGRKTGSVILGVGFNKAEGIVVDTHVGRISRLLGFTREKDAVKIERDLMKAVDKKDWIDWSHLLIFHGRAICVARRPDCAGCPVAKHCKSASV